MLKGLVRITRTHSLTTGYNAPLYQGSATSSWPQQEAAVHLPLPTYPSVPALPRGREYPPVARQASTAPLSRLASSLHPRRYVAPINRGRHPYARPQVVPNSGGLGSNFTSAGGLSLPTVRSPSPYIQSYEGCKSTPFRYPIRTAHSPSMI